MQPRCELSTLRQFEDIQRIARLRMVDLGGERARGHPRAAAAQTGRDGDVLPAADAEGDRRALDRGAEPRPPERRASFDVYRPPCRRIPP